MLRVRVARRVPVALDVVAFDLVAVDGAALPPFRAGAHVDVLTPCGVTRQYSLCNPPDETGRYQIAVLREAAGRGGSRSMHDALHEGRELSIGAPRNHFPLADDVGASLLLAGGIGITPLLCMAEELSRSGRAFELHYCTRSVARTAFRDRLLASPFASSVRLHHDDGPEDGRLRLDALLGVPRPGTHVYTCGPRGFMDAVLGTARGAGWADAQLHCESFSAGPADQAGDREFEVELARSRRVIRVDAGQTVVAALAAHGVAVPTSCEQGVCGTCLTRVLEGLPDHRDVYLTPQEQASNDQFLPCCSRSKSPRLVLDL